MIASIRLDKKNKTIKILSKEGILRLVKQNKTIKVVNRRENIRLQHTGRRGPEGPQGPNGESTFLRVYHGADSSYPRPDVLYVEWVGTVPPDNATLKDTWIDTDAPPGEIPIGGLTGQILSKKSDSDYDYEWIQLSGSVDSVNGKMGVVVLDQDDISDGINNKQYSVAEKTKLFNITGTNTGDQDLSELASTTDLSLHVTDTTNPHSVTKTQVGLSAVPNTDFTAPVAANTAKNSYPLADATKLSGIETNATANDTDVNLKARANHTGVQAISTITGLQTDLDGKEPTLGFTPENLANKGSVSGYAELDGSGKVPAAQLPSFVDDVIEVTNFATLPAIGEAGKIYVTLDDNSTYRWGGSAYVEISSSLALGETPATAYRGDRGKTAYDHSLLTSGNPHSVTKSQVGLGNTDNTSDANKPVSTAQQTALNAKKTDSMATNKLLGRGTAGTGAIEEITIGSNLSLAGTTLNATSSGTGDVVGPASATDNAIARYDGTTGKLVQGSGVIIDDNNAYSAQAGSAATVPMTLKGATSQTADLTQWQNSSGTVLAKVNKDGWMGLGVTPTKKLHIYHDAQASDTGLFYATLANSLSGAYTSNLFEIYAVNISADNYTGTVFRLEVASTSGAQNIFYITGGTAAGRALAQMDNISKFGNSGLFINSIHTLYTASPTRKGLEVNLDDQNDVAISGRTFQLYGVYVDAKKTGTVTDSTHNIYGAYLKATGTGSGSAAGTAYGLYIDSISGAVTNNYGIYLASGGINNAINWAGDTNLYRSAADTLKTDDKFVASSVNIGNGVAVPATATSTGDKGDIAYDSSYIYLCTATNVWVRAALATW